MSYLDDLCQSRYNLVIPRNEGSSQETFTLGKD